MPLNNDVECVIAHVHGTPVFVLPSIGEELRRIFGATYIEKDGVWLFPAYHPFRADVLYDFKIVIPNMRFSEKCLEFLEQDPGSHDLREDYAFYTKPYDHQKEALQYVLKHPRCGVFYDCGLGKTKIIIDLVRHERKKTLILVPVVGLKAWENEVKVHADDLVARAVMGQSRKAKQQVIENAADVDILVITYESAKRYFEELIKYFPYGIIVADESHNLRGHRTGKTKCAVALASRVHRRLLLSGTPSLGDPQHLFGQLLFLAPYIPAKDHWTFRKRFLQFAKYNKRMVIGYKNLDLLNQKLQRISIRRMKDECLDLPPRRIVDIEFEIIGDQKKKYNELVSAACLDLGEGKLYEAEHAAVVLQKLLQILSGFFIVPPEPVCDGCEFIKECVEQRVKPYSRLCRKEAKEPPKNILRLKGNAKLDVFSDLLDSILVEPRNKVIVWAYFREELNILGEYLKKRGIGYVRVDGSNSSRAQTFADDFNTNPKTRVYLAQISTGTVITLNSAAYTIYFGLSYRLDDYLQSIDRNYRIGQEKKVFVYRLVAKKSVLEFVSRALEAKEDLATTLIKKIDCVLCALSGLCADSNVQPFDHDCIYDKKVKRVITHPGKL